jgi:putative redox protein
MAATHFLRDNYEAPEIVIGQSLGGAVALAAAPNLPRVKSVATIGAPASPAHIEAHIRDDLQRIRAEGEAEVVLAGRRVTFSTQLLDDIQDVDLASAIRSLDRPLLVLHSPIDNTVGIENAAEILEAARHPKSFVSLDTADHLITNDDDARYAGEVIASWSTRYISADLRSHAQPDFIVDAPESVTMVRTEDGFRTEVISPTASPSSPTSRPRWEGPTPARRPMTTCSPLWVAAPR